jgi:hypothetical protein
MEKKYPKRIFVGDIGYGDVGKIEYISKEEFDAIVRPLISALQKYKNISASVQNIDMAAKQALENYKNMGEGK